MKPNFDPTASVNFTTVQKLQAAFALEPRAIAIALPHCRHNADLLPTILWQYGLISLQQLDRMLDWLVNQADVVPFELS
jgi:hypothetical protein